MKSLFKYAAIVLGCWTIGFAIVSKIVRKPMTSNSKTNLELSVKIIGNRNQPVANAHISVLTPAEIYLGKTDLQGSLKKVIQVPAGGVSVLQASGPTFRIRKDMLVPNHPDYQLRILIEPKDFKTGSAELVSRDNPSLQNLPNPATSPPSHTIKTVWLGKDANRPESAKKIFKKIAAFTSESQSYLSQRQVASVGVRYLRGQSPFFEVLLLSQAKEPIGSFLASLSQIQEGSLAEWFARTRPSAYQALAPSGQLQIYTTDNQNIRAYLDGTPIPKITCGKICIFKLVHYSKSQGNTNQKIQLSVTGSNGPLIQRELESHQLQAEIKWTLPINQMSNREKNKF